MTSLALYPSGDGTSAWGAMLFRRKRSSLCFSDMPVGVGAPTAHSSPQVLSWPSSNSTAQTTAGALISPTRSAGVAIGELRRLSGLTWDQLARVFGVSRRSLHFWASGKAMTASNEEHLQRVLAVVRKIDRGAADTNRSALLSVCDDGSIALDHLIAGNYELVISLLGLGNGRRVSPSRLSEQARAARAPRPPEELVGALQDRIHPTSGRLLAAKAIVTTRRK